MNRVRIFACAGTGLVLAAMAWFLSDGANPLADVSPDMLSRSAGVALLGVVLATAGLVFRAAMRVERKPASAMIRPHASEYRRGFDDRAHVKARPRRPVERGLVIALRAAVAEQGKTPATFASDAPLPMAEIERLQHMLRNRAMEMTKRRLMRSGVDQHGLAP